ncbi:transposase for insertion sequence [Escherichia coli DEC2E]|nr:transposase for insertion sequence [Escherichia coli DEC2E]
MPHQPLNPYTRMHETIQARPCDRWLEEQRVHAGTASEKKSMTCILMKIW